MDSLSIAINIAFEKILICNNLLLGHFFELKFRTFEQFLEYMIISLYSFYNVFSNWIIVWKCLENCNI